MGRQKVLIISSSGGSGHIQAARAKRAMLLKENPDCEIVETDLLKDLLGCGIGPLFVNMWNSSQKSGKTHLLELYGQIVVLFDLISFIPVYYRLLKLLVRGRFTQIVDVQPCATPAITRAVRAYHRISGIKLMIEKYVIEFPTERVVQYFKPIKLLTAIDRSYLSLVSLEPLTSEGQSPSDFWMKHCKLSMEQVVYTPPLIRESFYNYRDKKRDSEEFFNLPISVPNSIERLFIMQSLTHGPLQFAERKETIFFTLTPKFKVVTLMLGSQPAHKATLRYVDHFIKMSALSTDKICLFVFCSNQTKDDMPLIESICKRVINNPDHPKNLTVFPMPYQSDDVIAPLYHRSDATITRSGGVTSMELHSVSRGKIWIHTEKPLKNDSDSLLAKIWGMPSWEEGNAGYLKAKKGADLVCPDTFSTKWEPFFRSACQPSHPSLSH
jgi:hypothetical protein